MATEKEYDEQIAPLLLEISKKCGDLGMSLVARVEWEKDKYGLTCIGCDNNIGAGQLLTKYAAHVRGNFDALAIELKKRFGSGGSIILHTMSLKE